MAHDPSVKNAIRAYYETHNESVKEVWEKLKHLGVPKKTIEDWSSKEAWQKNKFKKVGKQIDTMLEDTAMEAVRKASNLGLLDTIDPSPETGLVDTGSEYSDMVAKQLVFKSLDATLMQSEMGRALEMAKKFADTSTNIGTIRTYITMLKDVYEIKHGKNPDIIIQNLNGDSITTEVIASKSDDELLEMIQKSKEASKQNKHKEISDGKA